MSATRYREVALIGAEAADSLATRRLAPEGVVVVGTRPERALALPRFLLRGGTEAGDGEVFGEDVQLPGVVTLQARN